MYNAFMRNVDNVYSFAESGFPQAHMYSAIELS